MSLKILNLYTSATCNLNCIYCYIDKSSALQKIDKILEESFKSDYYLQFSKKLFNKEDLQGIHFWGGEPSQGLHRVYHLIPKFIEYYPNLCGFAMSTNFTISNWFDEFYGFLDVIKNYPNRKFEFRLQLSIDGPTQINDKNRGMGTTAIFLNNFYHLMNTINIHLPGNVKLKIHFKQTFSNETIYQLQKDKINIIEYFNFFDKLISDFKERVNNPNIFIFAGIPNTAVPSPHSIQDGKYFANYSKLTREIEKENLFKNYKEITTYPLRKPKNGFNEDDKCYSCGTHHCGAGIYNIGLLPEEQLSLCHSGFSGLLEEYNINSKNNHSKEEDSSTILQQLYTNNSETFPVCIPFSDYEKYKNILLNFYNKNQTFQMVNTMAIIQMLALTNQIDAKFLNKKEAHLAAQYFLNSTSWCMRNFATVTGTITTPPIDLFKLIFNGAYEYIIRGYNNDKNS